MLRTALERKLGIPLDGKTACIKAAELLREGGRYAPSGTTLYHLFVAREGARQPYAETLHALSRHLGYSDWHAFRQNDNPDVFVASQRFDSVIALPELLSICLRKERSDVLDEFFDRLRCRLDHPNIHEIGLAIYRALFRDAQLEQPFYAQYAAQPVVRKAFFELMADPDFKLAHADEGLRHYLQASGPEDDEHGFQDRLFARSMLFKHHFMRRDPRIMALGKILYSNDIDSDMLNSIHPFPAIRYLTYAIWYDVLHQRTAERKRRESMVLEWVATRLMTEGELGRNIIFHTLIEGALQVGILDRLVSDIEYLFPEVDPDILNNPVGLRQWLAERDPNGLRLHFEMEAPAYLARY